MFKKIAVALIFVSFLALCFAPFVGAQTADSTVSVPASMLTAAQRAQIELTTTEAKVAQYGQWVGLGAEIGQAVNGSLAAVTDQTANFARTEVGKVTMAIVVWKVVGNDIIGLIFTFFLWLTLLPCWIWSFKKNVLPTVSTEKYYGSGGERLAAIVTHWVILGIMVIISAAAMF